MKRKRYENIVAPDKSVHTNNYDVKFSNEKSINKGNSNCTVTITHYSNGDDADLTVIVEDNGLEI